MAIKDWPKHERPRERLLHQGPGALSDTELLAIFLRTGRRGVTAVELARELLQDFGNLHNLLACEPEPFMQRAGLGPAKYVQLQAALEMTRRALYQQDLVKIALSDPAQARNYLLSQLGQYPHEVFACLFLDTRHRIIKFEQLFRGTLNGASVYPREVVKRALQLNTAAVIFAHNHPSGVAEPSEADRQLTQRLQQALDLVEIQVLDHFIIGVGETVSFAERGLL